MDRSISEDLSASREKVDPIDAAPVSRGISLTFREIALWTPRVFSHRVGFLQP
jgi:hypothetical protein